MKRFLLVLASIFILSVIWASTPVRIQADGGGQPTFTPTPTVTPTPLPTNTETLIPTSPLLIFPPTNTPTPVVSTALPGQAIPGLLVATPQPSISRAVAPITCGVFALVVLLLTILGVMYIRNRIRAEEPL